MGVGAGLGGWAGRSPGVDLTAGTGRGRLGSCAEKAAGFIINPPRLNIVSSIMFLVFIFLIAQALRRFCVAAATELSPPGPLALDCSKGRALRASPFSILSPSYPETTGESSQKRKIFRPSPIWQMGSARTAWDSGSNRDSQRFIATAGRDPRSRLQVRVRISTTNKSDAIAGMFMPIFEGELGDPRFIELAQAFCHHAIVLFLGRAREP